VAFPNGFNYIQGSWELRMFPVSSTGTFTSRNPVSIQGSGVVAQYAVGSASIAGIAMSDSSQSESIAGVNQVLVGVPDNNTVFATHVQTGVATSALTAYGAFDIELDGTAGGDGEHFRLDTDSTTTGVVRLVPRGDGTSDALSADSSVYVQFSREILEPFGSSASIVEQS
jgi:hypothetical protein